MVTMKQLTSIIVLLFASLIIKAQEMNAKIIVMADQISGVDPKIFKTLEKSIGDLINNRKWTSDNFETKEKIECVFTIILSKPIDGVEGGYTGKLNIQASRPVFNTTYTSTMVNYVDNDLAIKYDGFQQLDFNDTRVSGNDPLVSNLTAVLAYYTYVILGLDYDSFSLKGGSEFFSKAQNIVNNAPEHKSITGWKATENQRNRFWLADQLVNVRFTDMRTIYYKYHRLGLDQMTVDPELARTTINSLFPLMERINTDNPSSLLMRFFFSAKSDEIQNFLAKTSLADKQKIVPVLTVIDVTNANKYLALLK